MRDITYCMVKCGNNDCYRNGNQLKPGDIESCAFFTNCEDFVFVSTVIDPAKIKESVGK